MATRPTITPLPTPPNRQSGAAEFAANADVFMSALPPLGSELNAVVTYVDGRAVAVEQFANSAQAAAGNAADHAGAAGQSATSAQTYAQQTADDRAAVETAVAEGPVILVNGQAGIVTGLAEADMSNVSQETLRAAAGVGSNGEGSRTVSTQAPSGTASEGDIWYRIEQ